MSMTIGVIDSQKSIFYSAAIRRAGKAKKSLWARPRDVEDPEIQGSGFSERGWHAAKISPKSLERVEAAGY